MTVTHSTQHWLGMEAPRYTSYPSAHHFSADTAQTTQAEWLSSVKDGSSVSLYMHVPFCRELCWFCGCHTKMTKRYEPISKYVGVMIEELALLKRMMGGRGKITNLHFGGGSPSLLVTEDLHAIFNAIHDTFDAGAMGEAAIELDPRTTSAENIALYASLGMNRVSIGIQDFDLVVQQAINRVQSYEMVATVVDDLRSAGLEQMNTDLIYGLPNQTPARFEDTLAKTLTLAPQRIALFSYAHVPKVKKHQQMIDTAWLPSEEEKLALYTMACERLSAAGYVMIGIDHFAKTDDPLAVAMLNGTMKRNFQGYVTDTTDMLIGVGSSSISQFPQGYVQNSAHSVEYRDRIAAGELAGVRGWSFVGEDILRKQVIDMLMCFMAVDLAEVRRAHGLAEGHFAAEIAQLRQEKYVSIVAIEGERIRLTTPYRMAVRAVASVFDQYHGVALGRYSKVA
jgi:oxygen-independent coproporphyrinogen-3 oxidase